VFGERLLDAVKHTSVVFVEGKLISQIGRSREVDRVCSVGAILVSGR
jgi:hypothetical protein